MSTAADLLTPLNIILMISIVAAIFLVNKFFGSKKDVFSSFKTKLFTQTIYDEMKEKLKLQGTKMKGKLYISFQKIALIERYFISSGSLPVFYWDEKEREMIIDEKKKEDYKFLILRCKSNNLIFRLFGLKKMFFIIKCNDKDNIDFDRKEHKIYLPIGTDLKSYGNVWLNSEIGMEYVNEISLKRMVEQVMTHVENTPDRVIHFDNQLAKNERLARTLSDIEKSRYEKTKTSDETVIS